MNEITMDYSRFRFRAVVDWIEIEVQTTTPTNAPTIRRRGSLVYATPMDSGPGGAATVFRFRLYDPENWQEVVTQVQGIAKEFQLACPPAVTAIEIAFDARSKGATREELAELTAHLYTAQTRIVSENRRVYLGSAEAPPNLQSSLSRFLLEGWQIGVGNKSDDYYQHAYFKTTDHNGKPIEQSEHRARIEVTLRGAGLPCTSFNEWEGYRFETLQHPGNQRKGTKGENLFRFRIGGGVLQDLCKDRVILTGERKARNRMEGGTRLYGRGSKADKPLNDAARYALRELSRRWRLPPRRNRGATAPEETIGTTPAAEDMACVNPGDSAQLSTCFDEKQATNSNNYTIGKFQSDREAGDDIISPASDPVQEVDSLRTSESPGCPP